MSQHWVEWPRSSRAYVNHWFKCLWGAKAVRFSKSMHGRMLWVQEGK